MAAIVATPDSAEKADDEPSYVGGDLLIAAGGEENDIWVGDTEWCLESLTAKGPTVSLDAACATPDAASTYATTLETQAGND